MYDWIIDQGPSPGVQGMKLLKNKGKEKQSSQKWIQTTTNGCKATTTCYSVSMQVLWAGDGFTGLFSDNQWDRKQIQNDEAGVQPTWVTAVIW